MIAQVQRDTFRRPADMPRVPALAAAQEPGKPPASFPNGSASANRVGAPVEAGASTDHRRPERSPVDYSR